MKFIMLINVKMLTIVYRHDIYITSHSESLIARKVFIFEHFSFYKQTNFHASSAEHLKVLYNNCWHSNIYKQDKYNI